jgi:magnesium-transporting ATPase (P-type)
MKLYNRFLYDGWLLGYNMIDFIEEFYMELALITVIFVIVSVICNIFYNKFVYGNTTIHNHQSYQTVTYLNKFRIKHDALSSDNSVYLTKFKNDGLVLLCKHIAYGYSLYFIDPINIYCLTVAVGQIYAYNDYRTLIPLLIAGTLYTFCLHIYSISELISQQYNINNKLVTKLVLKGNCGNGKNKYIEKVVKQQDLKRGDLIKLNDQTDIPADILLLGHSSWLTVRELELTGEDNDILRSGIGIDPYTTDMSSKIIINHKQNDGIIELNNKNVLFTSRNCVFRGTKIIDGDAIGIVLENGNDCKIYCISNEGIIKKTSLQKITLDECIINLYFMLIMASTFSMIIYVRQNGETYLLAIIGLMVILFNGMIPLSLQFNTNSASAIISNMIAKKRNITINRNGMNSYQIRPHFIVSDKTGTITTNELDLEHVYINDDDNYIDVLELIQVNPLNDANILLNIIACSDIQTHSKTGEVLRNDVIEQKLLTTFLTMFSDRLIENKFDTHAGGRIIFEKLGVFERLYYKPFEHGIDVKLGVIRDKENKIILHIQGTPEAVNKYSGYKLCNILDKIENDPAHISINNAYKRVIGHASKEISENELELLKVDPIRVLNNFHNVKINTSVYVFYDYIVSGVDESLKLLLGTDKFTGCKDFTLLTGDKMSSAKDIAQTIGIINNNRIKIIDRIEDIDSINELTNNDVCYFINGRLLDVIITSDHFINIIKASTRRVIYRATPVGKQDYILALHNNFRGKETMMIGDGLNDLSAIMKANIGISIKYNNNQSVQTVSEIVIDNWNKIIGILEDFRNYQIIIANIARWTLMIHMVTAFQLVAMLLVSNFEEIKDPASPYQMAILKGTLFLCMCIYCYDEKITKKIDAQQIKFRSMILNGMFIGLVNGYIIFSYLNVKKGIAVLLCVQVIQMILQLYYLAHTPTKRMKYSYTIIACLWIIGTIYSYINTCN